VSDSEFTEILAVELPDGGGLVRAEVEVGAGDVSAFSERLPLHEVQETIQRVGRWAVRTVRDHMPEPPDEVEVEFGIKLGVESGKVVGILAKASGETALTFRMSWKRPDRE
jgi:hypothetical protein